MRGRRGDAWAFAFADLWERWTVPEGLTLKGPLAELAPGDSLETCTILTTAANDAIKKPHDRMPVIVPRELFNPWLAGENVAFGPDPAGAMKVQPVSTLVNKPSRDVHRRAPGPHATLAFGVAPDVQGHPRAGQREVADRRGGAFRIRWRPPPRGRVPFRLEEGEATPPAWGCTMTDTLIDRNSEILGGTPVFAGTRVPVRILMEHLEAGDRLDDFLVDYPTVSRRQAVAVLERASTMLVSGGGEAAS